MYRYWYKQARSSRGQGVGRLLKERPKEVAAACQNCKHMGWVASARNERSLRFYQHLGAQIVTQQGDTSTFKWLMDSIASIDFSD